MYKRDLPETLRGEDEVFRWTDCTPVSSWAVENLVTTRDTGCCVGARGPSLRWKVYECGSLFGFVCESSGQTAFAGNLFFFLFSLQKFCYHASVSNQSLQASLTSLI